MDYFECQNCGTECLIEGENPDFYVYCHTCKDFAFGFDRVEYAAEKLASDLSNNDFEFEDDI